MVELLLQVHRTNTDFVKYPFLTGCVIVALTKIFIMLFCILLKRAYNFCLQLQINNRVIPYGPVISVSHVSIQ